MKNLPCTFILFIWLSCQNNTDVPNKITTSCQKLATIIQTKGLDTLALRIGLDEAIVLSNSSIDRKHDSLISVVCRLEGLALSKQDRLTEARKYYESGIQIGRRHLSPTEDIIVRCYRNMGASYFKSDDYPNALRYYDSVQIIRSDSASLTMKVNNLIQSATCYQRLKDYYSAEKLASEACSTAQPFYSKSELAALYVQYAAILRSAHKYHASIEQAKKALSILIDFNKTSKLTIQDSATWADSYFYIAYALKDSGLYTLATPAYLRAIQLNQELGNIENQTTGLMNLSNTYRLAKQFDNAEKYLNQALQLLQKQPTLIDALIVRKGELYSGLDEVFMDKKEYSKALKAQESAINILTRYNESANLNALLSVHSYNLLQVLTDKAKTFAILAEKGVDTEGYQKALKLTDTIVALADDIRADYFSDDAKLTLANDIKPALEKAITLCQNLYKQTNNAEYLEKAFGFVEYSRSMVLYENARLTNQLPADLKAENEQLKAQEAALLSKNNIEELQKYLQHKRQFREKIKALNKNKLASIKDLQSNLLTDDQTAFIEYFVGDSSIFTFVLLKNMIIPFEIKKNKDFEKSIGTFRQEFTQHTPVSDATNFSGQATALYAILLRGPLNALPPTVSKLVIAPDGVLAYLPFEILTPSKISDGVTSSQSKISDGVTSSHPVASHPVTTNFTTNFKQADFLLKHFTISYAYSANLLLLQKQAKQRETKHIFASFIAKYEEEKIPLIADNSTFKGEYHATALRSALSRDSLMDLQGAKDEVNAIRKVIGNKAFEDSLATEGSFKREAAQYRILHLAMHAYADDQDPMLSHLLFTINPEDTTEDGDLTAAELYAMNLNADLAVLSACNTGFGTLSKGEGVMSLARAFTYAGVPATVTSLWEAPDATTPEIMESFYKNLKLGMPKDDALRQAKLTYLKNAHESLAANPYLWASFVPMGNMNAMDLEEKGPLSILMSDFRFWILADLGMLALVIWGFIWRRKKRK